MSEITKIEFSQQSKLELTILLGAEHIRLLDEKIKLKEKLDDDPPDKHRDAEDFTIKKIHHCESQLKEIEITMQTLKRLNLIP